MHLRKPTQEMVISTNQVKYFVQIFEMSTFVEDIMIFTERLGKAMLTIIFSIDFLQTMLKGKRKWLSWKVDWDRWSIWLQNEFYQLKFEILIKPALHNPFNWNQLVVQNNDSHKKRKYNLEGSLDRVLFAAELEFPKTPVLRLPQNTSNLNTECAGISKQLHSFSW